MSDLADRAEAAFEKGGLNQYWDTLASPPIKQPAVMTTPHRSGSGYTEPAGGHRQSGVVPVDTAMNSDLFL